MTTSQKIKVFASQYQKIEWSSFLSSDNFKQSLRMKYQHVTIEIDDRFPATKDIVHIKLYEFDGGDREPMIKEDKVLFTEPSKVMTAFQKVWK